MESLYFLVPCAMVFLALAIKALFWAINSGQYDNLDTEAHRILFDSDAKKTEPKINVAGREEPTSNTDKPQEAALHTERTTQGLDAELKSKI